MSLMKLSKLPTMVSLSNDEVLEIHKQFTTIAWLPTEQNRYTAARSVVVKMACEIKKRRLAP